MKGYKKGGNLWSSKELNTDIIQKAEGCDDGSRKKKHKRLKFLYKLVKEQVEFYLSDANLSKDRFLKQFLDASTDGAIPLCEFLKFNKLKSMTKDLDFIRQALSSSSLLKVSEDGECVSRVTPFIPPTDTDERTIYVEKLPANTTHDSLRSLFKRCGGHVVYTSIPRFRSTGEIKNFAFVEFEKKEETQHILQLFENDDLSLADIYFPKGNKQLQSLKRRCRRQHDFSSLTTDFPGDLLKFTPVGPSQDSSSAEELDESSVCQSAEEEVAVFVPGGGESGNESRQGEQKNMSKRKRTRSQIEGDVDAPLPVRRKPRTSLLNSETASDDNAREDGTGVEGSDGWKRKKNKKQKRKRSLSESTRDGDLETVKRRRKHSTAECASEGAPETVSDAEMTSSKHCRKRRKKRVSDFVDDEGNLLKLVILSKSDWEKRKRKYLAVQKANMQVLKGLLSVVRNEDHPDFKEETNVSGETLVEQGGLEGSEYREEMNSLGDGKKNVDVVKDSALEDRGKNMPEYTFVAGCILKIKFKVETTRNQLKDLLWSLLLSSFDEQQQHSLSKLEDFGVGYLDFPECGVICCIRFTCAQACSRIHCGFDAHELVESSHVLEGEDETQYWNRLNEERLAKRSKGRCRRRARPRGRDRWDDYCMKVDADELSTRVIFDD